MSEPVSRSPVFPEHRTDFPVVEEKYSRGVFSRVSRFFTNDCSRAIESIANKFFETKCGKLLKSGGKKVQKFTVNAFEKYNKQIGLFIPKSK